MFLKWLKLEKNSKNILEQRVNCLLSGCGHNDCNLFWSRYLLLVKLIISSKQTKCWNLVKAGYYSSGTTSRHASSIPATILNIRCLNLELKMYRHTKGRENIDVAHVDILMLLHISNVTFTSNLLEDSIGCYAWAGGFPSIIIYEFFQNYYPDNYVYSPQYYQKVDCVSAILSFTS